MTWDASRRVFLRGAGLAAVGVGLAPTSLLVRTARAAVGDKVLVKVFLRGAADGLNFCAPYGDPEYYNLRQGIALPRPGSAGGVVNLDGYFGMHPEFGPLQPFFNDGRLAFVHAVGNPQVTRSHFDAQDFQESGTPGDKQTPHRLARPGDSQDPGHRGDAGRLLLVAARALPPGAGARARGADALRRSTCTPATGGPRPRRVLTAMYRADSTAVGTTGLETFEAVNTLLRAPTPPPSNGASYPTGTVGNSLRQAAGLVKTGIGTRCIYVNVTGGFDTHSNQLTNNANDYRPLGQALAAFATDLGGLLDNVVLMVTTEFGRTAAVNGAAGTDHGTGYAMLVLGGRVRGGRVLGRWPGLGRGQLYENRDLAATTDFRDVFQEVARAQFGIAESLFPGYTPGPGVGVV